MTEDNLCQNCKCEFKFRTQKSKLLNGSIEEYSYYRKHNVKGKKVCTKCYIRFKKHGDMDHVRKSKYTFEEKIQRAKERNKKRYLKEKEYFLAMSKLRSENIKLRNKYIKNLSVSELLEEVGYVPGE